MKIIKGIAIFSIFITLFGSCFDQPEFPNVPEIEIESYKFKPGVSGDPDSLIVSIKFKDGNGDLGFSAVDTRDISDPYNAMYYFLENGNGGLEKVTTKSPAPSLPTLLTPATQSGKLIRYRTRKNPEYSFLPPYTHPYSCTSYVYDSIYVEEGFKSIFDASYNVKDTFKILNYPEINTSTTVYMLIDTFYYEPNPNHYNIEVDFMVKRDNPATSEVEFEEFDWRENYCSTYDGRFPRLTENSRPVEGTLKYAMNSTGFYILFRQETLKLRIQIKDRALNKSNITETAEFKLDDIRQ